VNDGISLHIEYWIFFQFFNIYKYITCRKNYFDWL